MTAVWRPAVDVVPHRSPLLCLHGVGEDAASAAHLGPRARLPTSWRSEASDA